MVATVERKGKQAPTEKARAEVERLHQEELTWGQRQAQAIAAAAESKASAGAALLAGGVGALRERATAHATLHAEINACALAVAEARRRRQGAILAVWQADAAALRGQARTLRQEADERQKTTDGLLAQLEAHEGCQYVPVLPVEAQLASLGYAAQPGSTYQPPARTDALRAQADGLEHQATVLEARPVTMAGAVGAQDREGLLGQLTGLDPLQIGPTVADVLAWLDVAEPRVLEQLRIRTAHAQGAGLSYEVVWAGGELDKARSRVSLREHGGSTHRA